MGGRNDIFYNLMSMDEYTMLASHGQIRFEHNRVDSIQHDTFEHVHEMINDTFRIEVGMEFE